MSGINPKFLNVEKKVQYNIRVNKRLIDKINAYAELSGKTTTNVINTVLSDFIADKVLLNDYLDNIGGVAVKIPYSPMQKKIIVSDGDELTGSFTDDIFVKETPFDSLDVYAEYLYELFEVKKIPNNLDIFVDDSYVANVKLFNKNATHSGIELFVYNLTDIIFDNKTVYDDFDSFTNCLYCLYFEVGESDNVDIYLIDYIHAINLLSASGNDDYKDLIVACVTELEIVDEILADMKIEYESKKNELDAKYTELTMKGIQFDYESDKLKDIRLKYETKCDDAISEIAKTYNSNNIIEFGSDIFDRIAIDDVGKIQTDIIKKEFIKESERIVNEVLNEYLDESDETTIEK